MGLPSRVVSNGACSRTLTDSLEDKSPDHTVLLLPAGAATLVMVTCCLPLTAVCLSSSFQPPSLSSCSTVGLGESYRSLSTSAWRLLAALLTAALILPTSSCIACKSLAGWLDEPVASQLMARMNMSAPKIHARLKPRMGFLSTTMMTGSLPPAVSTGSCPESPACPLPAVLPATGARSPYSGSTTLPLSPVSAAAASSSPVSLARGEPVASAMGLPSASARGAPAVVRVVWLVASTLPSRTFSSITLAPAVSPVAAPLPPSSVASPIVEAPSASSPSCLRRSRHVSNHLMGHILHS